MHPSTQMVLGIFGDFRRRVGSLEAKGEVLSIFSPSPC